MAPLRCILCGATKDEPHGGRCSNAQFGGEGAVVLYQEWPDDIKAERDRHREALEKLDGKVEPGWRQATIDLALRPLATNQDHAEEA